MGAACNQAHNFGRIDGRDGQTLTSIRRNAKKIIYVTWTRSPGINAFTGQLGFLRFTGILGTLKLRRPRLHTNHGRINA